MHAQKRTAADGQVEEMTVSDLAPILNLSPFE